MRVVIRVSSAQRPALSSRAPLRLPWRLEWFAVASATDLPDGTTVVELAPITVARTRRGEA